MGTRVNVVKLSLFIVDVGKYFQASLVFAAKAGVYLVLPHSKASSPCTKILDLPEKLA